MCVCARACVHAGFSFQGVERGVEEGGGREWATKGTE